MNWSQEIVYKLPSQKSVNSSPHLFNVLFDNFFNARYLHQQYKYKTKLLFTSKIFKKLNFRFGTAGETNVQGEEVKKLDVLANELFINMLKSSYTVALLISEENETVIEVSFEYQQLEGYCIGCRRTLFWKYFVQFS